MTALRKRMLEELQRRNYSAETARLYLGTVKDFARYFGKSPDKLGQEDLRQYKLYLLNERTLRTLDANGSRHLNGASRVVPQLIRSALSAMRFLKKIDFDTTSRAISAQRDS